MTNFAALACADDDPAEARMHANAAHTRAVRREKHAQGGQQHSRPRMGARGADLAGTRIAGRGSRIAWGRAERAETDGSCCITTRHHIAAASRGIGL